METKETTPDSQPTDGQKLKPFGPVAAVFYAAGIGAITLGVLTTLAEASASIKSWLEFSSSVGALSGTTIIEVIVFLVSWAVLHAVLKDKDPEPRKVFLWTAIMIAIAVVLTFPVFFQAFAPKE
jgi:cytosine/uracil/thiamine/allantoin permease